MSNNEVVKSVNKFCSSKGIVLYSRYDIYLIYIIIQYTKYAYCTALLVHMYLVSTCFYHTCTTYTCTCQCVSAEDRRQKGHFT